MLIRNVSRKQPPLRSRKKAKATAPVRFHSAKRSASPPSESLVGPDKLKAILDALRSCEKGVWVTQIIKHVGGAGVITRKAVVKVLVMLGNMKWVKLKCGCSHARLTPDYHKQSQEVQDRLHSFFAGQPMFA